jgi:hemerythrin-like domain-containing protein
MVRVPLLEAAPDDPVELFLACHGRIRRFAALAVALAEAGAPPEPSAAAAVLRYFDLALPRHREDEEESFLPRLRGRATGLDQALCRMVDEHREHLPMLKAVLTPLRRDDAPTVLAAVALQAHLLRHLREEEEDILPSMRELLTQEEKADILLEMRSRRAVAP